MKKITVILLLLSVLLFAESEWEQYVPVIKKYIYSEYTDMFREPEGALKHPFIVPGSAQYPDQLWDWDSWWTNVALRQILQDKNSKKESQNALKYEKGCV